MSDLYVYENIEVVLTGRTAERALPSKKTRRSGAVEARVDELVEIKPKNKADGSFARFVRMTDLYKIASGEEDGTVS